MRSIREILRLSLQCGQSHREISRVVQVSPSTVGDYLLRAKAAGLSWPLPETLGDIALEDLLFPAAHALLKNRPVPNFPSILLELRRKGVTKALLWQEYKEQFPTGYQYSQFCDMCRQWSASLNVTMRQDHKAGEKVFSDFAGTKLKYVDAETGVVHFAHVFVCALGASSYFFAQAFDDETTESWVTGHVSAFNFFGGSPEIIVPDNPKSVITVPCKYEPIINRSFLKMASHYSCAVIPARVREPQDKAKVESAVGLVTRWIIARLRNRTFFSLYEINSAIRELVDDANARPFKKLPGSRKSAFEQLDKPALNRLPVHQYEFAEFRRARVGVDYHVEFEGHWYSCPFQLAKQEVELRITKYIVEIIHKNERICSHSRSIYPGRHTTILEHMPKNHQEWARWSPERLMRWASQCGESVQQLTDRILRSKEHPAQGIRACLGILSLGNQYGHERLNLACSRALAINTSSVSSVRSILKTGLDQKTLAPDDEPVQLKIAEHQNLRGSNYFFAPEDLNAFATNN